MVRGETTTSAIPSRKCSGTSVQSRRVRASKSERRILYWGGVRKLGAGRKGSPGPQLPAPGPELLPDVIGDAIQSHPFLLHRVAVPDGDGAVRQGFPVDGDAERCASLIHAAIPAADGTAIVVKAGELLPQIVVQRRGQLGHSILLDQRKDTRLDRGNCGRQSEHDPGLALDLLFPVRVDQKRQGYPIGPGRSLHDVREVPLILRLIEVLEFLPRVFLMPAQIEVTPIVDAFDL